MQVISVVDLDYVHKCGWNGADDMKQWQGWVLSPLALIRTDNDEASNSRGNRTPKCFPLNFSFAFPFRINMYILLTQKRVMNLSFCSSGFSISWRNLNSFLQRKWNEWKRFFSLVKVSTPKHCESFCKTVNCV